MCVCVCVCVCACVCTCVCISVCIWGVCMYTRRRKRPRHVCQDVAHRTVKHSRNRGGSTFLKEISHDPQHWPEATIHQSSADLMTTPPPPPHSRYTFHVLSCSYLIPTLQQKKKVFYHNNHQKCQQCHQTDYELTQSERGSVTTRP